RSRLDTHLRRGGHGWKRVVGGGGGGARGAEERDGGGGCGDGVDAGGGADRARGPDDHGRDVGDERGRRDAGGGGQLERRRHVHRERADRDRERHGGAEPVEDGRGDDGGAVDRQGVGEPGAGIEPDADRDRGGRAGDHQ